jgi:N-acetylglutamate synthase-like GNAT family acetyltransferase
MTIRECVQADFNAILAVINDSAQAYRGVIPADCWHDPYMSAEELRQEMKDGVTFRCMEKDAGIIGVMGFQDKGEVALIRHAYVSTPCRGRSVGTKLLKHIEAVVLQPILIGTWAAATWAVSFYEKNGYTRVAECQKNELLRKYWSISDRQIDASVVLGDAKWVSAQVPRHRR